MKAKLPLGTKLKLYSAIGWGLIVLFSFLGALLRKPAAPYVLFISVIMWGAMRILSEAREAIGLLGMIKRLENGDVEEGPKDDDAS